MYHLTLIYGNKEIPLNWTFDEIEQNELSFVNNGTIVTDGDYSVDFETSQMASTSCVLVRRNLRAIAHILYLAEPRRFVITIWNGDFETAEILINDNELKENKQYRLNCEQFFD